MKQQAKQIEFAYPTSITAQKHGFYNTGCWFVVLTPSVNSCMEEDRLPFYSDNIQTVMDYANSLPQPYSNAHLTYFNI